jgi:DNA replication and repair protein RecF
MSLIRLNIVDFRNIAAIKFEPIPDGFNIIYGDNGSGKTSLLEAIYYLSLGRSFKSSNTGHIVRKSAKQFAVYSNILLSNNRIVPVGIERRINGSLLARLAGEGVESMAEIASLLPVQLINSNCYNLLDAGPGFRRKYLDWGAFYYSNDFLRIWRQYKRILKQRNASLTARVSKKELDVWNAEMASCALSLHRLRQEYVQELLPVLQSMVSELLVIKDLKIEYYPGWDIDVDYKDVLSKSQDRDFYMGYTQFGPHRANIDVRVNQLPAKDILSRGQQKLFVCAMILAQGALLFSSQNRKPIYLIDDLPSELDMTSRSNLVALLSKQDAQIFVTAVDREIFDSCLKTKPVKMFHVEHGTLKQMGSEYGAEFSTVPDFKFSNVE